MFLPGVADGGRGALRDRVPDPDSAVAVGAAAAVLRNSAGMVKKICRRLRDGRGGDFIQPWSILCTLSV